MPHTALRPSRHLLLLACTAVAVCGCKSNAPANSPGATSSGTLPAASTAPVANAGTITGTVSFTGAAPARVPIDMSMDPACAMAQEPNLTEQYIVTKGKLANVFITVRSGASPTTAPANAAPVVLDQKGCRYTPHVIALQQGGAVTFTNSDPTMHNVHAMPVTAGAQTIDLSEQPSASKTVTLVKPEDMMPVRCNNHPWMNAFINVATTPYFAVTGTDGSFILKNLPPGQYTIAAIHEKLGEQDTTVTVPANGKAAANFSFAMK